MFPNLIIVTEIPVLAEYTFLISHSRLEWQGTDSKMEIRC